MKLVPAKSYAQVMAWRRSNPAARAWWNDNVRQPIRERAGFKCEACGKPEKKVKRGGKTYVIHHDLHHLHYRNLFNEDKHLDDLVYLCRYPCHHKADLERVRKKKHGRKNLFGLRK